MEWENETYTEESDFLMTCMAISFMCVRASSSWNDDNLSCYIKKIFVKFHQKAQLTLLDLLSMIHLLAASQFPN